MTTLYDLLGVHPDADDETLKWAFRQALAAKPAGPSANADPVFQNIVASGILKDAKQLAVYERILESERHRLHAKSKRIVATNAIAASLAILASTVATGYAVLAPHDDTAAIFALPDDGPSSTEAAVTTDRKNSAACRGALECC
jgi:DnaJ-class molecular chaperone